MDDKALRQLVEPIVGQHGLELDHLEIVPAGRRKLLRITVDGDGPAGRGPLLDDIAAATRSISDALDDSPVTGSAPFTLEVSSRGVSAPLTEPKHFRRNTTRLVKLTLVDGGTVSGRIVGVGQTGVTLDVQGITREFGYAAISKALVQVELNRPAGLDENADDDDLDDDELDDDGLDDDALDDDGLDAADDEEIEENH